MNGNVIRRPTRVVRLYEWLFSLNIGFAITYALFAYDDGPYWPSHASKPVRDFLIAFSSLLRHIAPLTVHRRTHTELLRSAIIREVGFVAVTLGIGIIIFSLLRIFARTAAIRLILHRFAGITALAAVPVCWLYIVEATWPTEMLHKTFWGTYGYASALEIAVAGGVLFLLRQRAASWGILVFALHYVLWVVVMGERSGPVTLSAMPLSLAFLSSGIAWLAYDR